MTDVEVVHVGDNLPENLPNCSKEISLILAETSLAISSLLAVNFPNLAEQDLSITLVLLDNRKGVKEEDQINLLFTEEVDPYRLLNYLVGGLTRVEAAIKNSEKSDSTQVDPPLPNKKQLREDIQESQGSPCYPLGRTMH